MATIISGKDPLVTKILDALGVKGPVCRVVIDIAVRDVAKVYIQRYLDAKEVGPICNALSDVDKPNVVEVKDVQVDEKGAVTWQPIS